MGVDGSPRFPGTLYAAPSLHLQQASDSLSVMAVKSQRVSLCERVSEYEPFKSADHRRSNATQVSTSGVLKDSGAAKRVLVGATLVVAHVGDPHGVSSSPRDATRASPYTLGFCGASS